MQHQFDVAYTHWSNGAEAMVMILFKSIGMDSVMKIRRSLFGRYNFSPPEFAVKELRKLRLTRALTSKLASDMESLRFKACEFALIFCWLLSSFV